MPEPSHASDLKPSTGRGRPAGDRSPGDLAEPEPVRLHRRRWIGFAAGIVAGVAVYLLMPNDVASEARVTAGVAVLMGVWWMTEAVPIPATALVPIVAFPVLNGVELDEVGASYGNNIIFLFLGGFLIGIAMQRWNLHRRIALVTVNAMGTSPSRVILGFMVATGFVSMWVSNTATAVMMLPIGISVLALVATISPEVDDDGATGEGFGAQQPVSSNFGTSMVLGIAYAASLGSLGTLIGTPPNAFLAGYLAEAHDITIGFGQWMLVGVPISVVFVALAWWLLTKVLFKPEITEIPGGKDLMRSELRKLGRMGSGEKRVLAVFVLAAVSWVTVPLLFDPAPISDAGIAIGAGLLLFILPAGANRGVRLLDWESAVKLPWGVLLLFGGGLALSAQFTDSGLSDWIGTQVNALGVIPVILLVAAVAAGVLFLTEITSNTATAATFVPVAGGVALGLGLDPMLLTIPVALAATCAFMLPVATPPNAIAFGSGYVTIGQMIKGGIWLNVAGIVLITVATMTLAVAVFGIVY